MLRGLNVILKTLRAGQNVIDSLGATRTLNANESGSLVVLDRAAGTVVTLPAAAKGLFFDFVVAVSVTSNAFKIITSAGTEFLVGGYTSVDTDTSNAMAFFTGNGTSHVSINMTAASSNALGGLKGTQLRLSCMSSTLWMVEGTVMCAGAPATAFATS